jgi:hypothetical protein
LLQKGRELFDVGLRRAALESEFDMGLVNPRPAAKARMDVPFGRSRRPGFIRRLFVGGPLGTVFPLAGFLFPGREALGRDEVKQVGIDVVASLADGFEDRVRAFEQNVRFKLFVPFVKFVPSI